MTRQIECKEWENKFTPFSKWIRTHCKDPKYGLVVTNLDYVFNDYKQKKVMLIEEKQYGGCLHYGQKEVIRLLNSVLEKTSSALGYEYWGFYLLQFNGDGPETGMKLNGVAISEDDLIAHLNFERKFCKSYQWTARNEQ